MNISFIILIFSNILVTIGLLGSMIFLLKKFQTEIRKIEDKYYKIIIKVLEEKIGK